MISKIGKTKKHNKINRRNARRDENNVAPTYCRTRNQQKHDVSLSLWVFLCIVTVRVRSDVQRRSFNYTGWSVTSRLMQSLVSSGAAGSSIACVSWMMGWNAYSRGNRRGNPRPWISSPSVVRNDPRSCRENLSRALVLDSRQEPRGLQRGGEAKLT